VPAGLAGCQRCGIYLGEAASKPFRWIVATNGGSVPTDDSESADGSNLSAGTAADRSSATTVSPAEAIGDVSPRSTLLAPRPTPAPATSQSSAATAVSVRQGAFKVMASEVQLLIAALDAAPPDVSTVHAKALHLEQLGAMIPDLFAFDTHAFMTNTTALPKIWQEESQFDAKANKFVAAMQALVSVSSTADAAGDSNLTLRQTAARALAICGECHVVYGQPGTPGTARLN
jgi:cytochrome c556